MQCTSYFPGYYSRQDLNGPSNGGPWPIYANNLSPNMSNQFYNNLYPSQNVDQIRLLYHDEVLKQTILRHDNLFREQVQELHRLHKKQRELMDEFKRIEQKKPQIASNSHYNFIFSKISSDCSSNSPWLNPSSNKLSTLSSSSPLPTFNFLNVENEELKKSTFSSKENNSKMLAFDLNMPPETETPQNIETKNEAKCLIDLNSCVEDELFQETVSKIDLEAPISPPNKESYPPRGESEENLLETRVQISKNEDSDTIDDQVKASAETILTFNDKKSAFLVQSLDWFAGVVVSSLLSDNCVVALPSQQGKRQRKRRMNRKILEIETLRSGFRSWGNINKKRRGCRVPVRNIRLLWN